jgi:hypothetical protein
LNYSVAVNFDWVVLQWLHRAVWTQMLLKTLLNRVFVLLVSGSSFYQQQHYW